MTNELVYQVYKGFQENPTRLTYSHQNLCKQFNVTTDIIKQAKQLYKLNPKDFTVAEALLLNQERDFEYDSIPASKLFEVLTGEIPIDFELDKYANAGKKWGQITSQGVDESYKELSAKHLKDSLEQAWNSTQNPYSDEWEVKQKWVKGKEGSQLLVRKQPESNYLEEFKRFVENYTYVPQEYNYIPNKITNKLGVVCLFDIHLGKIAFRHYTGNSDSLAEQERNYVNEFSKLLKFIQSQNISEIILPIGNDLFNVDNPKLTTLRGTPQSSTEDLHGMFELGLNLMTATIQTLANICKVNVVLVCGNHAPTVETYLALSLETIFRQNPLVSVDHRPISRKYYKWGKNLIGLSHGELPLKDYARVLPFEAKDYFSECDHFEILVGDKHKEELYKTPVIDGDGVTVRRLGALTKVDKWHYDNLYTLSKRRSYVLVYDKERGLEIQYTNNAD